jgi:hypothetical protein
MEWVRQFISKHRSANYKYIIYGGVRGKQTGSLTCLSLLCAGMRPARHSFRMHVRLAENRFISHLFGGGRLHDDLLLVHDWRCLCRLCWRYIIIIHLEQIHNSVKYMQNPYVTVNLILKVTVLWDMTSHSLVAIY